MAELQLLQKRNIIILLTLLLCIFSIILSRDSITNNVTQTHVEQRNMSITTMNAPMKQVRAIDGGEDAFATNSTNSTLSPLKIFVFTLTKPSGNEARKIQREVCRPLYDRHGIKHMFAVGKPSYDSRPPDAHIQGQLATQEEIRVSQELLRESEQYKDILVTPNRDYYRDINEKLLSSMRYAVDQGFDFILKTDDEYCVDIDVVKELIRERQGNSQDDIYMGIHRFNGDEYENMKGSDGTIAPFMSGWIIGLTRNLASTIVGEGWVHSMLVAPYGTSSDDANLGKWVDWATRKYNMTVQHLVEQRMKIDVIPIQEPEAKENVTMAMEETEKVSCGNHDAPTCADCSQGNGEDWCHGDCVWLDGECLSTNERM
uniref:Hexosyltransferase n=1 Tax=Skeletonema marinoi TaxID=267567 RepID=A0A7S2PNY4_9STRA|mmetsp:Transcript_26456/g.45016  ORF Transcript_26456/g.45016 Transcript_26456/m.45016 type:complete len:372 (+) Transcript_26456:37-1152(+)